MASKTFVVNGKKVTVRSVNAERPTGLMSVGWTNPGPDINVTVDGVKYKRIGGIHYGRNGTTFSFYIGSQKGLWNFYNTLSKESVAPYPVSVYKTEGFAFTRLCEYIRSQLEGKPFIP